jgi:hypothetical protein
MSISKRESYQYENMQNLAIILVGGILNREFIIAREYDCLSIGA